MKAITYIQYGPPDVLQLSEIAKPIPAEHEVLIKVRAASVNPLDWHFMRGEPFVLRLMTGGLSKPKVTQLGVDAAGVVEAVGASVTKFKKGDEVYGAFRGAFAEYACANEKKMALKPGNISFEEAAAVPVAAITALQALRDKGKIREGQKVLIEGASGGVGTFAVQIAKSFGAEVTAVCGTTKLDTSRSLGADKVIDYTREDFTKNGERYDLILGANSHHSVFEYRRSLAQNGIYVGTGGGSQNLLGILFGMLAQSLVSMMGGKKLYGFLAKLNGKDLDVLSELLSAGKIVPFIDKSYALAEVPEAVRYLEAGHAAGKVVISVG
jgi:NADPH:quinone reductase-like Zn-dependent oxidoreductase